MAETSSQTVINDIPERYHPYRDLILNSALGLVYTPEAIRRSGVPGAQNLWGNITAPTTNVQTQQPTQPQPVPVNPDVTYPTSTRSALQNAAAEIERSLRVGYAGGGRLASSAQALEEALFGGTGDVNLGPGGAPTGWQYPGLVVSPTPNIPTTIPTGTRPPPTPAPPSVTPPTTATPGGTINTPPGGPPLTVPNPNPIPPPAGTPGGPPAPPASGGGGGGAAPPPWQGANSTTPQFLANRPNNFAGSQQAAASGYNPNQYADDSVASELANRLGGQNVYTNTGGPNGPPSQATISFGGNAFMNAGLINNAMQTEDKGLRELRLNGIREEIRQLGGTPGFSQGGTVRAATGFGGTANAFSGPSVGDLARQIPAGYNFGPPEAIPASAYEANNYTQGSSSSQGSAGFNNSLTNPFDRPDRRTSSVPVSASTPPTTQSNPLTLGGARASIDQSTNPFAGTTPPAGASTTENAAFGVLNPYQAYQGQRTLGMGANFGQVGSDNNLQVSDQTRAGLQGVSNIPSYFENGEIRTDRDIFGRPSTNFGIANDTFDTAGNLAIGASQVAQEAADSNPLRSTFQDTMRYLQENPSQFTAGDISLGQLTAPQLEAPLGISPSQLTSYQMAGPRLVDTSGSNINPLYVGNPNVRDVQADASGTGISNPNSISAMNVGGPQIRDITADARGTNVTGEGYNAASMDPAGRFIDPNNPSDYMSPYQQAVTDTRLSQAQRNFDENRQVRSAQAVRAGAFGGSRQAVADSIAGRDLANQKDAITAEGAQSAYENAQQQYERDRQARLNVGQANQNASNTASQFTAGNRQQASMANQDNARQFGLANLSALMQGEQLRANLGQQAQLANQSANLTADTTNLNAQQQTALANQSNQRDYRLANLNAGLQTQQLGATLGQDAARSNQQAALTAAGQNQQTGLQAQLANQQALQQANQQNLNAALGVQELGANQALTAQQANQAAGLTAGQSNQNAALTTQALARNSGLTAAQANQQTRLDQNKTLLNAFGQADQLQQQAAQGNASNRLNAIGQQTNSALAANTIGQSRADLTRLAQAMELQRLQALQGAGSQVDARTQQATDLAYQDFINQQNDPYQKINWMQSIMNGTPMGYNQEQVLFNRTNPASQATGLATAGLGALSSYYGGQR